MSRPTLQRWLRRRVTGHAHEKPRAQKKGQEKARGEAADMSPPSHHDLFGRREEQHDELKGEPAAQHVDGGNAQGQSHEEQYPNAGTWIEQHIAGHDAADGSRGADEGGLGTWGKPSVNERGTDA